MQSKSELARSAFAEQCVWCVQLVHSLSVSHAVGFFSYLFIYTLKSGVGSQLRLISMSLLYSSSYPAVKPLKKEECRQAEK